MATLQQIYDHVKDVAMETISMKRPSRSSLDNISISDDTTPDSPYPDEDNKTTKESIQKALLEPAVNDWIIRDSLDGKSTFKSLIQAFDEINVIEHFGAADSTIWYEAVRDPAFQRTVYQHVCQKNTLKKFPAQASRVDLDGLLSQKATAVAVLDNLLFVNNSKKIYKYTIVPTRKDGVPILRHKLYQYPPSERRISLRCPQLATQHVIKTDRKSVV